MFQIYADAMLVASRLESLDAARNDARPRPEKRAAFMRPARGLLQRLAERL